MQKPTIIYLAYYKDSMYPEDDYVFGTYFSQEEAIAKITEECAWYAIREKDPSFHKANISYYKIIETELCKN